MTLIWFVFALNKASQLGPLTEEEEMIPKDHPVMIPLNILGDNFTQTENQNQEVQFFFGIDSINYENVSLWNASYVGEPVMSP